MDDMEMMIPMAMMVMFIGMMPTLLPEMPPPPPPPLEELAGTVVSQTWS